MQRGIEEIADQVWDQILSAMPKELQQSRALVEALRYAPMQDSDAENTALADALQSRAVATFGTIQTQPEPARPPAMPVAMPTEQNLQNLLANLIDQNFSAATDGSPEWAEILSQRAMGTVARELENNTSHLGWFARRRLRKFARNRIAATVRSLSSDYSE